MNNWFANNNPECTRKGENANQITFRRNRLFAIDTDWYFSKHEGIDKGPYSSKKVAGNVLNSYIRDIGIRLLLEQ